MDPATAKALTGRYVQAMLAAVLLAVSCLLAGGLWWLDGKAGEALAHKGHAVGASLQSAVNDALAFGSPLAGLRGVDSYMDMVLAANPDIQGLAVADQGGHVLFRRGAAGTAIPLGPAAGMAILPVGGGGGDAGFVAVVSRPQAIRMVFGREGGRMALALAACLGLAGLAAIMVARGTLLAPLRALCAHLTDGAAGRFEDFAAPPGGDELALFGQALAVTSLQIRERADRFAAYTEELTRVVADPAAADHVERLVSEIRGVLGPDLLGRAPGSGESAAEARQSLSLRARITLMVFAALVVISAAIGSAAYYFAYLGEKAENAASVARLEAAWRSLTDRKIAAMADQIKPIIGDLFLADAMGRRDTAAANTVMAPIEGRLGAARVVSDIEVADMDGNILYGDSLGQGSGALGNFAIRTMARTGEPITGMGLNAARRPAAIFAHPVFQGDRPLGAVVLIFEAAPLLDQLADLTGGTVFAVDLDGQLIYSRTPERWPAVAERLDFHRRGAQTLSLGGSVQAAAVLGIPSFGGGRLGYLVALRDIGAQQARIDHLRLAFLGFTVGLLGLVVGLLFHYLRQTFAPLDNAISALNTLARGETTLLVNMPATHDEVGRIGIAIGVFRDRTRTLSRLAEERGRRRRRQERMIRRQMLTLAETLQDGAREAVLKDLDQIEKEASSRASGADIAAELDALAIAFQTMSARVREQHLELDLLVGELREALKAKTAFIALQQELGIARELQLSILPRVAADEPDFAAHALMIPAEEVGGDFYDFFFLSPRRVGIVVADVSGKGVPAALFMAVSRTLLKATATFGISPGPCLTKLNNLLYEGNEKSLFVTVFYGILDLDTGVLTYANGGHNPPMRVNGAGAVTVLEGTNGIALAVVGDLAYREGTLHLAAGDTLVLYTDGVTEAKNPVSEEFGEERLVELLATLGGMPSSRVSARVMEAVHDFAAGGPQTDDITCLTFTYKGAAATTRNRNLQFGNDLGEVPRLLAEVETFARGVGASRDVAFNLSLGLDEAFTNVVSYGYDDRQPHSIALGLDYDGDAITAILVDDGKPFNPLAMAPPADLTSNIDDRRIGGLGVYLVCTLMDEVRYCRDGDRNRLMLKLRLAGAEAEAAGE